MRVYKVEVKTTNAIKDTTSDNLGKFDCNYYDCQDGILYVVTSDPSKIYDRFSKKTIISITDIGVGYYLCEG